MEAIVATVIAVIAALGLAYTFGIGRSNINRFELARSADAIAQSRMESLNLLLDTSPGSDSLAVGTHPNVPNVFAYHGAPLGVEYWRVDAAPVAVPSAIRGRMVALTTIVRWTWGGFDDSIAYTRVVDRP